MSPSSGNDSMLGRLEAQIMAESALIDKESGRVFWEGGSSTLSASLTPKVGEMGLAHLKATILTSILVFTLVGFLAHFIRRKLEESTTPKTNIALPLYQSIPLLILEWTLLKTPTFDMSFFAVIYVLYLLEAYTCSTRRFLANAISSPDQVEEFIEQLRHEPPVVTWKVRCFHYEKPFWLSPLKTSRWIFSRITGGTKSGAAAMVDDKPKGQQNQESKQVDLASYVSSRQDDATGPVRRKVVSHHATQTYSFGSFVDDTMAGVWKRAASSTANGPAPFMKIVLSKILVLSNERAREDYFKQQSKFVTEQGMKDKYAEYSTNIEVPGFKRRMLAVRPVEGVASPKLFRLHMFWIFTVLGMSLPFRIWFARRCDQLRVTVVKETFAETTTSRSPLTGWFYSKPAPAPVAPVSSLKKEEFRKKMREFLVYTTEERPAMEQRQELQQQLQIPPPTPPVPQQVESEASVSIPPGFEDDLANKSQAEIPSEVSNLVERNVTNVSEGVDHGDTQAVMSSQPDTHNTTIPVSKAILDAKEASQSISSAPISDPTTDAAMSGTTPKITDSQSAPEILVEDEPLKMNVNTTKTNASSVQIELANQRDNGNTNDES